MKKLLVIVMMTFANLSFAEAISKEKPVYCFDIKELYNQLQSKYGETLSFSYQNDIHGKGATYIAMFTNKETGSWTLIEYSDSLGCVLGAGRNNSL
ncbi:MAG: hypothetical protein EBU90_17750 [Proteobacteria bacterium]|nr:hypothetical protein [Pseudomonadota bacterium]